MSRSRATPYLLTCGAVAALLFVGLILLEGARRPEYDALHRFGSELALGDHGWVQVTNFVVAGLLVCTCALGMRWALATGRGAGTAPAATAVVGLSLVVGGVFVADAKPGYPEGSTGTAEPTLAGVIHDANIVPFHAALLTLLAVLAWRFAARPRQHGWAWFCAGAITLLVVSTALAMSLYDGDAQTGEYHGLWQRVSLATGLGSLALLAVGPIRREAIRREGAGDVG